MKIALIVYVCIAVVWFIAVVYSSYRDKYWFERNFEIKATIRWGKIIFGTIFWPIDMLIYLIKAIAMKNSR
mgnify:CR=1 FL=1